MQIHEITRKPSGKEPVNEILGLAANLIGGIAKQGMNKFVQNFTPQLAPGDRVGSPTDRAGSMKVTQPIIDALVPNLQKAWAQSVQSFLANSKDSAGNPATSLRDVTTPSIDSLKNDLVQMINNMISPGNSSFSYQNLPRMVGDDPVAKQAALEIATAINTNIQAIFDATVNGAGTNAIKSAFVELVKDGIAPAQNSLAYDRGSQSDVDIRVKRGSMPPTFEIDLGNGTYVPFDRTNPRHVEAARILGFEARA
jgi:hypothetical protein